MIPFKPSDAPRVTQDEMQAIYQRIRTPKKLGAVVKWENDYTDSPTVFFHNGRFYMYFIAISKDTRVSGYETHLSVSDDLVNWSYVGPIFRRNDLDRWDSRQCAGYAAFMDIRFDGSYTLGKPGGSYYISYLAGNSDGYEPDPLYMGLAKSTDPTDPNGFERFPTPILSTYDSDVRPYEEKTLYKSFLFEDTEGVTGYKYVNAYNAKDNSHKERIFLAVSNDAEHWERYGDRAVLDRITDDPAGIITGDPQIVRMGDIYIMHYFHFRAGAGAYDTFAFSRDLVNWTLWDGEPLISPTESWENVHAHKPWCIFHNGIYHHFYCAVNDQGERFIALAVSE